MNTTTNGEARPPQGLTLQETADGLAVIGHPHRTYKARHELKRHGARWNATRRQWEATTPHDCDTLRRWLTHQEPATAAPSTTFELRSSCLTLDRLKAALSSVLA